MPISKHILLYLIAGMAVLLTACDHKTVYSHYEHTAVSGWERNDTLFFQTDTMSTDGIYQEQLGIRINGSYPFMAVTLIVTQTVLPTLQTCCDTLNCNLIDERGNAMGTGISEYQSIFPIRSIPLSRGHSLRIAVRHDMKREILPGICDIGIRLSHTD